MGDSPVYVHPTAEVSAQAKVGPGTKIWRHAHVREDVVIGRDCILGKDVYIDKDVTIGDFCKLQNGVFVFRGFHLESGVFLGPGVMLLNDKHPRAINADGTLKSEADWEVSGGVIGYGASIGGGAVVLPGVSVGRWALVGSGSVVTRDVPERGIVVGNPARLRGYACDCGHTLVNLGSNAFRCENCGRSYVISAHPLEAVRPA